MSNLVKRILSSIVLIPLAFYCLFYGSYMLIFFLLICFAITCYEWNKMTKNKPYKTYGFIFLIISFFTFYDLSEDTVGLLFVLIICVSTDIGGYVSGKIFNGPKLTKISPNKTYAGMLGGYLLSLISTIIFMNDISISGEFPINWFIFVLILSSISQLGDITISYFKRISKIKNTGKIIPGHGGLLDRVDGMIFAFPFSYIILLMDFL